LYPATPTLSTLAFQERLICDEDKAAADNPVGVEGGVVSGAAAASELAEKLVNPNPESSELGPLWSNPIPGFPVT
jgi:hypothetical protein